MKYHLTDHLGSVVMVLDGMSGTVDEANRYGEYGARTQLEGTSSTAGRYHFSGKEDQSKTLGFPYTDFGARHLSTSLRRWLVQDPLSEMFYGISPYTYCDGDPVNMVDEEGKNHILVGAITGAAAGAIINGGIALYDGKTGRDFWGAIAGGAINGAITGAVATATAGMSLMTKGTSIMINNAIAGTIGGAAGSFVEQAISDEPIKALPLLIDTAKGTVSGAATGALIKLQHLIFLRIENKYNSTAVKESIKKEVSSEMKSRGRVLGGKSTKAAIKREVANKTKDYIMVDKTLVNSGEWITDQAQQCLFQIGDYHVKKEVNE